ncbi:MAG: stage 0 sporulation family protein [Candidatus Omnitrophica bacterium]|nr:stage 0 sporulation family protein [Candidatus Omnitrophota bacterium]
MIEVIQVKLREAGKILYFNSTGIKLKPGQSVIVETEYGLDYGEVISEKEVIDETPKEESVKKVVRVATKEDLNHIQENKNRLKEICDTCLKKIQERNLNMKLVEAEYSFDRSKLVFYFTSEERIDFRDLVKDLAHTFKARIELKQIGVRDEAKLLGGFGSCGRALCCAKFLKDFEPVTIKMAKEQSLPLNPSKISGVCGRLMCCLGYESETYHELLKDMPRVGSTYKSKEGSGKIIGVNPLKKTITVEFDEGYQKEFAIRK